MKNIVPSLLKKQNVLKATKHCKNVSVEKKCIKRSIELMIIDEDRRGCKKLKFDKAKQ